MWIPTNPTFVEGNLHFLQKSGGRKSTFPGTRRHKRGLRSKYYITISHLLAKEVCTHVTNKLIKLGGILFHHVLVVLLIRKEELDPLS
jgi:hypothetical protein